MSKSLDDLVQKVTLHNPLPTVIHGYSLPFVFLYGIWFYCWVFVYGTEEYFEAGWIVLAGIGIVQILVSLSCYWSVHVRTLLTCVTTTNPLEATYAKVVPTPNNGSSQLVFLKRSKVVVFTHFCVIGFYIYVINLTRMLTGKPIKFGFCFKKQDTTGTLMTNASEE